MADSCRLYIEATPADFVHLERALGQLVGGWDSIFDEVDDIDGVAQGVIYEADDAYEDKIKLLAKQGFVFLGSHSEGGGYQAGMFAASSGFLSWVDMDFMTGKPFVIVDENLMVTYDNLCGIAKYYEIQARVQEHFSKRGI